MKDSGSFRMIVRRIGSVTFSISPLIRNLQMSTVLALPQAGTSAPSSRALTFSQIRKKSIKTSSVISSARRKRKPMLKKSSRRSISVSQVNLFSLMVSIARRRSIYSLRLTLRATLVSESNTSAWPNTVSAPSAMSL